MGMMIRIWLLKTLVIIYCSVEESFGLNFCNGTESNYGVSLVYSKTMGVTRCSCNLHVEDSVSPLLNYTVRVGQVRTELAEGGGFFNLSLYSGKYTRSIINVTLPERTLIFQVPRSVESQVTLDTGHLATSPKDFRLRIFSGSKRANITVACRTLSDERLPGSVSSGSIPAMSILSTSDTSPVSTSGAHTSTPVSITVSSGTSTTSPHHDAVLQRLGEVSPGTVVGLIIGTIVLASVAVMAMIVYRRRKLNRLAKKPCPPPRQPMDALNNTQCETGNVSYINVSVGDASQDDSSYYNVDTEPDGAVYENADASNEDDYDLACSGYSVDEPCYAEIPALKGRENGCSNLEDSSSGEQHHRIHNIYLNVANIGRIDDHIVLEKRNDIVAKPHKLRKTIERRSVLQRISDYSNRTADIMNTHDYSKRSSKA